MGDMYSDIRDLLDGVFERDVVINFHDLVKLYCKCLPDDLSIVFCIRERKWFGDDDVTGNYLIFQYLSFEFSYGKLHFFANNRNGLYKKIEDCSLLGFNRHESENCLCMIGNVGKNLIDENKLFNLTKRLFVTHYKNCGPKRHFIKSVSDRFFKGIWADTSSSAVYEFSYVLKYIRDHVHINCYLFYHTDEIEFHGNVDVETALIPVGDTAEGLWESNHFLCSIKKDPEFISNVKTSIGKKNMAFGAFNNHTYLVSTISTSSFDIDDYGVIKNYKNDPIYVAIFIDDEINASLDKVYIAEYILNKYQSLVNAYALQNAHIEIEKECSRVEIDLSINPVMYRSDFMDKYRGLLHSVFRCFDMVALDNMAVYIYDNFNNALSLQYVSSSSEFDEGKLFYMNSDTFNASIQCFANGESFEVWHPKKLEMEIEKAEFYSLDKKPRIYMQSDLVGAYQNFMGDCSVSIYCIPLKINNLIFGVIEFSSSHKGSFASERDIIRRIAHISGDVLRRLELANDRGWLTRMQFLYAARHRLERVIESVPPAAANDLRTILGDARVNVLENEEAPYDGPDAFEAIIAVLERNFDRETFEKIKSKLIGICNLQNISMATVTAIKEIFEAFYSNKKHSPFNPDYLHFFAGSKIKNSSPIIIIVYSPEIWLSESILDQICVSPIRGKNSIFHYGLFLLGAFVRMSGGIAQGKPAVSDRTGIAEFGISVMLPVHPSEESQNLDDCEGEGEEESI